MKVNETSQNIIDYNKGLDDKLRNISKSKEKEIERVNEIYEKKVETAKSEGENRYANSIKHNDEMLASLNTDYEEKLKSYQDSLNHTQKNLAESEQAFKNYHAEKMLNLKEQAESNVQDEFQRATENQRAVHQSMKRAIDNVQDKSRAEQHHIETKARMQLSAIGNDYNQKSINQERDYRARFQTDALKHEEELRVQKSELKNVLDKNMQKGKQLEAQKLQVQKEELDYLDHHQKDMLAQRESDFKIRYQKMVEEHEKILNDLKTQVDSDIKKMIASSATQMKTVSNKLNDSFYRVETLNPKTTELEKEVIVAIKIPEYEQENVHLSVHGRDVKMTLSRKYTDSMEAQDGSINKSTRNELFSKEFTVTDILDPKKITQKYENGTLTFKILKA